MTIVERAKRAEAINNYQNKRYHERVNISIECPYCKTVSNMHFIQVHLRLSKRCKKMKELWLLTQTDKPEVAEAKILLKLNEFKQMVNNNKEQLIDDAIEQPLEQTFSQHEESEYIKGLKLEIEAEKKTLR